TIARGRLAPEVFGPCPPGRRSPRRTPTPGQDGIGRVPRRPARRQEFQRQGDTGPTAPRPWAARARGPRLATAVPRLNGRVVAKTDIGWLPNASPDLPLRHRRALSTNVTPRARYPV